MIQVIQAPGRSSPSSVSPLRKSKISNAEQRMAAIVGRIRRIPRGSVQTYGGIDPEAPRLVGRVLATTHQDLPWHRVVRADGSLSQGQRQRELLLEEGVPMRGDRVDMKLARRKHLSKKESVPSQEATQA